MSKKQTQMSRRLLLRRGTISSCGLVGVAMTGCSTIDADTADLSHETGLPKVASNGYVTAQSLSRSFSPPLALDLRGQGEVVLRHAGGARIYYWDTGGTGTPVILVHAGTGSAYVWGYQQEALVAAGYRVIAYSRRGYRGSDPGPVDENNRAVEGSGRPLDDLEALVEHLGVARFHLLGHAAGGGIANGYIKAHPQRILSSISVAALQSISDEDWTTPMNSIRVAESFSQNPAEIREVGPSYRWANPDGLAAWMELEHSNRPVSVGHAPGIEVTWHDIISRTFPTLLIGGDADLYAPPSMYRYLHSRVPNSELYIVPETGHSIYWEQPDIFNQVVMNFLNRHSS